MRREVPGQGDPETVTGRFARWCLALGALVLVVGCLYSQARPDRECTKELFAMDTVMRFTAYGARSEEAVDAAIQEVQRLDALLSTGSASSEVSQLNRAGGGAVSEDTARLLSASLDFYRSTGGLFDCTIYPLMELWGFSTRDYHVPAPAELAEKLPLADFSRVRFDGQTVHLAEGQALDFGGIAKGYAAQRVCEIFQSCGVDSGNISLGGNVQVLGTKPDGTDWRIGIQDPGGVQGTILAVLPVQDRALVTSGGYERYFEEDGKTYIHILDPRTGCPAETDLLSVTIVSSDGMLADALSTALFIMGSQAAADYWRGQGCTFDMVLVTEDLEIWATENISASLETQAPVRVLAP